MPSYYFDSSALVKNYVQETGTAWVRALIAAKPTNEVITALVTGPEIVAALARRVRIGLTMQLDATVAINAFRYDFQAQYKLISISPQIILQAMTLAERHGLRGYDSIQLACAVTINAGFIVGSLMPLIFISADAALNRAAISEGLLVDNPNNH